MGIVDLWYDLPFFMQLPGRKNINNVQNGPQFICAKIAGYGSECNVFAYSHSDVGIATVTHSLLNSDCSTRSVLWQTLSSD